jgi:hypothetical protein
MPHAHLDAAAEIPINAALFTSLERTVLQLARSEQGTGLLPTSSIGRLLNRLSFRLFGLQGVRPLADPRLEALRSFVNALHRCGSARIEGTAAGLRSAGFDPVQESWIRSSISHCG